MPIVANNTYAKQERYGKKAVTITPSNTDELADAVRAIYVGGLGDLKVIFWGDSTAVIFKAVPVGTIIEGIIKKVEATGTTATLLVGIL